MSAPTTFGLTHAGMNTTDKSQIEIGMYITCYRGAPIQPIFKKHGRFVIITNIISCIIFSVYRLKGLHFDSVENFFCNRKPICRPYNTTLHYRIGT